jgi:hypothetical protein
MGTIMKQTTQKMAFSLPKPTTTKIVHLNSTLEIVNQTNRNERRKKNTSQIEIATFTYSLEDIIKQQTIQYVCTL